MVGEGIGGPAWRAVVREAAGASLFMQNALAAHNERNVHGARIQAVH